MGKKFEMHTSEIIEPVELVSPCTDTNLYYSFRCIDGNKIELARSIFSQFRDIPEKKLAERIFGNQMKLMD